MKNKIIMLKRHGKNCVTEIKIDINKSYYWNTRKWNSGTESFSGGSLQNIKWFLMEKMNKGFLITKGEKLCNF